MAELGNADGKARGDDMRRMERRANQMDLSPGRKPGMKRSEAVIRGLRLMVLSYPFSALWEPVVRI
jgi:hypothetical protein